jgi:hypothetical protein
VDIGLFDEKYFSWISHNRNVSFAALGLQQYRAFNVAICMPIAGKPNIFPLLIYNHCQEADQYDFIAIGKS